MENPSTPPLLTSSHLHSLISLSFLPSLVEGALLGPFLLTQPCIILYKGSLSLSNLKVSRGQHLSPNYSAV